MSSTAASSRARRARARRTPASRSTASEALVDARELRADVEVHAGDLEAERARLGDRARARRRPAGRTSSSSCAGPDRLVRDRLDARASAARARARRRRPRRAPARPARRARRSRRPRPRRASSSSDLLLPWKRMRSPGMPAACAKRELAERRDVGADALLGEHRAAARRSGTPSSRRRRARPGAAVAVRARLRADRLLAVDDERRPVLGRERGRGDAAERELAARRRARNRGRARARGC